MCTHPWDANVVYVGFRAGPTAMPLLLEDHLISGKIGHIKRKSSRVSCPHSFLPHQYEECRHLPPNSSGAQATSPYQSCHLRQTLLSLSPASPNITMMLQQEEEPHAPLLVWHYCDAWVGPWFFDTTIGGA